MCRGSDQPCWLVAAITQIMSNKTNTMTFIRRFEVRRALAIQKLHNAHARGGSQVICYMMNLKHFLHAKTKCVMGDFINSFQKYFMFKISCATRSTGMMETYFVETAKLIEADVIVRILVYDTKAVSDILNTGFTVLVIYAFASFQNYFNPSPLYLEVSHLH